MKDPRWELDVRPTAAETFEGMTLSGRVILRRRDRALWIACSIFIGLCAPLGAAMNAGILFAVFGGFELSNLPAATFPIAFALFLALTIWLARQSYYMIARASVRSRFGRAQQIELDRTGVTLRTEHSVWQTGWAEVTGVRGGKTTLALCISGIAIVIPRRTFAGPHDFEDALTASQQWVEASR